MNDQAIEQAVQSKGLNAPRVTLDELNANIAHIEFVKHIAPSGQVLRWAVITTRSGFAVTGRPSASVSPENDNAEIGERVALDNARGELWPLMGYALRERLAAALQPIDPHDDVRQAHRFQYTPDIQVERETWRMERQAWEKAYAQAVGELRAVQSFILSRGIRGAQDVLALTGGQAPKAAG